jgi:NAD(P)-dependent dehydrogenase (short-subunit alcohol dehydrogenase family)
MAGRLAGKVAIITGSTSGIGRRTAEVFAQEGARVVVSGRRAERGEQVAADIRAAGGEARFFQADVAQPEQVQGLVRFAVATYGRLDILMNNAWSGNSGSVTELSLEDWQADIDVSLTAIFLGCKHAVPEMIKGGGGAIINTSSVHGLVARTHNAIYSMVKAAMLHLTRQMAVDYGPNNIRVNAICPGGTVLPEHEEQYWARLKEQPEYMPFAAKLYPLLGRPAFAVEIAKAALFLASDDASYVTGNTLVLDGGMTLQIQDTLAVEIQGLGRGK